MVTCGYGYSHGHYQKLCTARGSTQHTTQQTHSSLAFLFLFYSLWFYFLVTNGRLKVADHQQALFNRIVARLCQSTVYLCVYTRVDNVNMSFLCQSIVKPTKYC